MLEVNNVSVSIDEKKVLENCSLLLKSGERAALMGPSGCGKTTLLRVAALLQIPEAGSVKNTFSRISFVFQEPRLLPWRTAEENVNLVLSDTTETLEEARKWLRLLELDKDASLYPSELSGGMQQRVSLARALAAAPDFLILDEAFKGLDAALRERVISIVASALPNCAFLTATHSMAEAEALGCRVLQYRSGCFLPD